MNSSLSELLLGIFLGMLLAIGIFSDSDSDINYIDRDEIAAGQRWYVATGGQRAYDYYIQDITDETILFINDKDEKVRYKLSSVEFVELVPQSAYR